MLQSLTWYNYTGSLRFGISMDKLISIHHVGKTPACSRRYIQKRAVQQKITGGLEHERLLFFHWEFHHPN